LLGLLITYALRTVLKRSRLSWADHLLGAGFGLLRGWLVCSALYLALTAFPVKIDAVQRATFAPALLEGTRVIAYLTSRELRERFYAGYETIKRMWDPKGLKPTRPASAA
jgi:membrane protein required for colicin V production